jgi:hypothetical protein
MTAGFKSFLENTNVVVQAAIKARKNLGIKCARFGDCNDVSKTVAQLLKRSGIPAKWTGHYFDNGDNGYTDHSWVVVDGKWILDPTIDQFFSSLDEDMDTKIPGVYYSHPEWDGNKYVKRYVNFSNG